jgi:hypothetical protein
MMSFIDNLAEDFEKRVMNGETQSQTYAECYKAGWRDSVLMAVASKANQMPFGPDELNKALHELLEWKP